MAEWTRRKFLTGGAMAAAGGAAALGQACARAGEPAAGTPVTVCQPLDGEWLFRVDPERRGESAGWHNRKTGDAGWETVAVPHTWQTAAATAEYMGAAWYRREFDAPEEWRGRAVRLEFEAAYHTAQVWVNGKKAGEHVGKGYTAFTLDAGPLIEYGTRNVVAVRVDNAFSPDMLPRGNSYDWAPDGGLTRPVFILVTAPVFLEAIWVDALPAPDLATASLAMRAAVWNAGRDEARIRIGFRIIEESTGLVVLENGAAAEATIPAGAAREIDLPGARLENPELWHFDRPRLYVVEAWLARGAERLHAIRSPFGVRRIEVRGTEFLLNGEPVRLAGVERMAGSHPAYGMAEPEAWIAHDHDDLKALNCVFTRVHWQQDRRVLDACDRKGILIQVEVPSWGPDTFKGMEGKPDEAIMANGLEQLREMIRRDRNHPCIFSWGLCNEVGGQNPAAQEFVRGMLREAKRLDPLRLCSYASNSLQESPGRDVAAEMDFVEWNEYYETWYGGTPETMRRNLEEIHAAFPAKPIVISEYGYCACTGDRPENDVRRVEVLRGHNRVFRDYPWVAGLIFFDYNDYRTHIGDKGLGVLRQRVHGVVDVFGGRKPSYEILRAESSPVLDVNVKNMGRGSAGGARFEVAVRTRRDIPTYTLRGYVVRWTAYGPAAIPLEQGEAPLPDLAPGGEATVSFEVKSRGITRTSAEVVRPTGFGVSGPGGQAGSTY